MQAFLLKKSKNFSNRFARPCNTLCNNKIAMAVFVPSRSFFVPNRDFLVRKMVINVIQNVNFVQIVIKKCDK